MKKFIILFCIIVLALSFKMAFAQYSWNWTNYSGTNQNMNGSGLTTQGTNTWGGTTPTNPWGWGFGWGNVAPVMKVQGQKQVVGDKQIVGSTSDAITGSAMPFSCAFNNNNPTAKDIFNYGTCVLGNSIIPLLFLFASIVFMWGVIQYVIGGQEEAKKDKGKQFMFWGIIALFVAVSVWGLVGILTGTFNLKTTAPSVQPVSE
ncbi:MAG: pilin [Patescibacteria group bacterium]